MELKISSLEFLYEPCIKGSSLDMTREDTSYRKYVHLLPQRVNKPNGPHRFRIKMYEADVLENKARI